RALPAPTSPTPASPARARASWQVPVAGCVAFPWPLSHLHDPDRVLAQPIFHKSLRISARVLSYSASLMTFEARMAFNFFNSLSTSWRVLAPPEPASRAR